MKEVEIVADRERAELLLNPLRLRILEAAAEPASSAELARRLGLKPQKVNYHVQRLREHRFLRKVEERRVGNLTETVYRRRAERYVLASGVLGELSPEHRPSERLTAGRLLALQARTERELGAVLEGAGDDLSAVGALSLDAEFRFETAEQRTLFARAIRDVFEAVVTKYTSPVRATDGAPAAGRPYRLVVGVHPVPEGDGAGS